MKYCLFDPENKLLDCIAGSKNFIYINCTLIEIVISNDQNRELSTTIQNFLQHDKTLKDFVKYSTQQGKIKQH